MRYLSQNKFFNILFFSGVISIFFMQQLLCPIVLRIKKAQADVLASPLSSDLGQIIDLSPKFNPVIIKGLKIVPQNPFIFDFIVDLGDSKLQRQKLNKESEKLIKYFLAALTIPERDLWVNLSPHEPDRIIPESFGETQMGQDLLAQDYLLKQLTSSLMYPENQLGKIFWNGIYEKIQKKYGVMNIPMNIFNKVWILPETAMVFENKDRAFVVESRLKVVLAEDFSDIEYVLPRNNTPKEENSQAFCPNSKSGTLHDMTIRNVMRDVILPSLETEVNQGKGFAPLRQIYNAIILATWFKRNIREGVIGQHYTDQRKIDGIKNNIPGGKERIYQSYLENVKKGAFDYIREDFDPLQKKVIPRHYFSGGMEFFNAISQAYRRTTTDVALTSFSSNQQMRQMSVYLYPTHRRSRNLKRQQNLLTYQKNIKDDAVFMDIDDQAIVVRKSGSVSDWDQINSIKKSISELKKNQKHKGMKNILNEGQKKISIEAYKAVEDFTENFNEIADILKNHGVPIDVYDEIYSLINEENIWFSSGNHYTQRGLEEFRYQRVVDIAIRLSKILVQAVEHLIIENKDRAFMGAMLDQIRPRTFDQRKFYSEKIIKYFLDWKSVLNLKKSQDDVYYQSISSEKYYLKFLEKRTILDLAYKRVSPDAVCNIPRLKHPYLDPHYRYHQTEIKPFKDLSDLNIPSFKNFMDNLLHNEKWGYYATGRVDFVQHFGTFPIFINPFFGHIMAHQVFLTWKGMLQTGALSSEEMFSFVEFGAGNAQLAFDMLSYISDQAAQDEEWRRFYFQFEYHIYERSSALRAKQRGRLIKFHRKVKIPSGADARRGPPENSIKGMIFSNEVPDAFGVHKIKITPQGDINVAYVLPRIIYSLQELDKRFKNWKGYSAVRSAIVHSDQFLRSSLLPPGEAVADQLYLSEMAFDIFMNFLSEFPNEYIQQIKDIEASEIYIPARFIPEIGEYIEPYLDCYVTQFSEMTTEAVIYVNTDMQKFIRNAAKSLTAGRMITVDYGDNLFAFLQEARVPLMINEGVFRGYYTDRDYDPQAKRNNPYVKPSAKDLTTDQDFTMINHTLELMGLRKLYFGPQGALLYGTPLMDLISKGEKAVKNSTLRKKIMKVRDKLSVFASSAIKEMGFKVIVHEKGNIDPATNTFADLASYPLEPPQEQLLRGRSLEFESFRGQLKLSAGIKDSDTAKDLGGIDLRAEALNLETQGNKIDFSMLTRGNKQMLENDNIHFSGLIPIIFKIIPVTNWFQLLGFRQAGSLP